MHQISEILCRAYNALLDRGQVSFPLTKENVDALDSVVKTIEATYFGFSRFSSDESKAAAYLCHLIKRHALTDGNKRLSLLWFEIFCDVMHLEPKEPAFGYDALAVMIESTESDNIDYTISVIQRILFDK